MIDEVKKILPELRGDLENFAKDTVEYFQKTGIVYPPNLSLVAERIAMRLEQIYQLYKSKPDPFDFCKVGIEPKPDLSRLLTEQEITDAQEDYLKAEGDAIGWMNFPLKGERRDDCIRKAQDTKTASIKDAEIKELTRQLKLGDKNYLDLVNAFDDRLKAIYQQKIKELFEEMEKKVIFVTHYAIFTSDNPDRLKDYEAMKEKVLK